MLTDNTIKTKRTEVERFTFEPYLFVGGYYGYGFDIESLNYILGKWDILNNTVPAVLKGNISNIKVNIAYVEPNTEKVVYEETVEFSKKGNLPIEVKTIYDFLRKNVFDIDKLETHFGFVPKIVLG